MSEARKFKALPIKSKGILYLYVRYALSSIYSYFIKLLFFFKSGFKLWVVTYLFYISIFILKQKFIFVKQLLSADVANMKKNHPEK